MSCFCSFLGAHPTRTALPESSLLQQKSHKDKDKVKDTDKDKVKVKDKDKGKENDKEREDILMWETEHKHCQRHNGSRVLSL